MELTQENLAGKTLLEVGSGRGDTTRRLVSLLENHIGAKLIATDLSDAFFHELEDEFMSTGVNVEFICTDACELSGIQPASVDYLVCNYTLCAVNAMGSRVIMALQRFWDVLNPGGWLLVEEEFPINCASTPQQKIWAEKWQILKAVIQLTGGYPYHEIAPEVLESMCKLVGFQYVCWTSLTSSFRESDSLNFFKQRLNRLIPHLQHEALRSGFAEIVVTLDKKAEQAEGFDVPYYRLEARK